MTNRQVLFSWILATLREAAWAPLSVFVVYSVLKAFDMYLLYPPLDIPTHFLGGVAIAYFFRSAIANSQELVGSIPQQIQFLLVITCTGTTTILWEFLEFSSDYLFQTSMMLGLEDTLKDMFLGLFGGAILLFWRRAGRSVVVEAKIDR